MKKIQFIAGFIGIFAGSLSAQAQGDNSQAFLDIIAGNGCEMTEAEAEVIFPQNGFSKEETRQIATQLMSAGTVAFADGSLRIVDGSCAENHVLNEYQQRYVDVYAMNGCQMTQDEAAIAFPANGMDLRLVAELSEGMFDRGIAIYDEASGATRIAEQYCTPANIVPMPPASEDVMNDPNLAEFLAVMAQHNCMVSEDDARQAFANASFDISTAFDLAESIADSDMGHFTDDEILVVEAPYCLASVSNPVVPDPVIATPDPVVVTPDLVATNDGSPMGVFVSVMVANGCEISEISARDAFPAAGLSMETVYELADSLAETADGHFSEDDKIFTMTRPECNAVDVLVVDAPVVDTPVVDAPVVDAPVVASDDPESQFLMMMASNGCEITQANARDLTDAAGMNFNVAMGIASRMLNDGRATTPDGGQTLQIPAPLCEAVSSEPAGPREIFIEGLNAYGCSVSVGDFGPMLESVGLDQSTGFSLVTELESEGIISMPSTRDMINLSMDYCQ